MDRKNNLQARFYVWWSLMEKPIHRSGQRSTNNFQSGNFGTQGEICRPGSTYGNRMRISFM